MESKLLLANALRALMSEQKHGLVIDDSKLASSDLKILHNSGFLSPILKGWSLSTQPDDSQGSTQWHASFWEFASKYLERRSPNGYCLNAEASLDLQTGSRSTPKQTVVMTNGGGGQVQPLPFETSMLFYPRASNAPLVEKELIQGVWVMSTAQALVDLASRSFFIKQKEVEIGLARLKSVDSLWNLLYNHGDHKIASAERLVGALLFAGRTQDADIIKQRFKKDNIILRRVNPFKDSTPLLSQSTRETSPYALRLRAMWSAWRDDVISIFPTTPSKVDKTVQLFDVDERHKEDAYHSLSIEGYKVTPELIERVERGDWNPTSNSTDQERHNAMAASGYYKAFTSVRKTIESCLDGSLPGPSVRQALSDWHFSLFSPSVEAGIVKREQLYGYRTGPVFIRNSKHTPLPKDSLLDAMEALFDLITNEPEASVRAVLGHHLFVFIHPYFDGNGRLARFLMNTMLVTGGYAWTVIKTETKRDYMAALESASVNQDIKPFAQFVAQHLAATPEHNLPLTKKQKP